VSDSQVRIRILVDDKAGHGLIAEHGFSLWIEHLGKKILFDTGQKDALLPNAERLGIDLSQADMLVLSHGHYDHTGGVAEVINRSNGIQVFAHTDVLVDRYSMRDDGAAAIQIQPDSAEALRNIPEDQIHWTTESKRLYDHVSVSGMIPRLTDFEDTGGAFFLDSEATQPDLIDDDQSIWIKTSKGLVVCAGCCHSGIINTLEHITKISGESKIHTLLGGLHLLNADENRLSKTVEGLGSFDIHQMYPCHCTGKGAVEYLSKNLSSNVVPGYAGLELTI
jgi:7,8-dihydropterin-6-yl-methyl-4-(beta-D-ribofuranosyl)aminobenzene 5'-phosphate synthase